MMFLNVAYRYGLSKSGLATGKVSELLGMKAFASNEISSHYFKREEQAEYDEMLLMA